jgi:FAD-linked oxidoreductase
VRATISRRTLLRGALAGAAATVLPRPARADPEHDAFAFVPGAPLAWRNWAGNQACRPAARIAPESEDALRGALASAPGPVRPVGAGHSFSALVPCAGTLLASDLVEGIAAIDDAACEAEVYAGTRLHALGPLLAAHEQALPNLPDIDYQTLGGAIATSTHGTGARFGSLSSYVAALTLATPRGELLECSAAQRPELFGAARCSLGALGVVTRVRLRNQRPYRLVETTRFEPLEDLLDDAPRRRDTIRNFELYALPHATLGIAIETDEDASGATAAGEEDPQAAARLRQLFHAVGWLPGVGDALYDRLLRSAVSSAETVRVGPSFQVLAHPRLLRFREMEYTVPAEAGPACLREVLRTIRERRIPVVFPIEYRYVARDDVWLSMFHARDGCSISVHQYADEDEAAYFAAVEPIFWKYEGRPHWGKLHSLGARELAALYPQLRAFTELRRELDPEGRLLNDHLRRLLDVARDRRTLEG